jgi:hypothetical protein
MLIRTFPQDALMRSPRDEKTAKRTRLSRIPLRDLQKRPGWTSRGFELSATNANFKSNGSSKGENDLWLLNL